MYIELYYSIVSVLPIYICNLRDIRFAVQQLISAARSMEYIYIYIYIYKYIYIYIYIQKAFLRNEPNLMLNTASDRARKKGHHAYDMFPQYHNLFIFRFVLISTLSMQHIYTIYATYTVYATYILFYSQKCNRSSAFNGLSSYLELRHLCPLLKPSRFPI